MKQGDLEIAEERLDYYSQLLQRKVRKGMDAKKAKRLTAKLDQWFAMLERWDALNTHY